MNWYVLYDSSGVRRAFVYSPKVDIQETIIGDVAAMVWEYAQSRPDLKFGSVRLESET